MKKVLIAVGTTLVLNMLSLPVWADQTNYAIGNLGASELKIGLGPRPVAMGEAFVAQADDVNSLAWNPAGLSTISGLQAGLMHDIYLQNTSLEYLAYAQNLFAGAGIGANVMLLNAGAMDKVDDSADVVGSFTPWTLAASVGYGQWLLPSLAVGGAIKFYHQNIDTSAASAVAVDLGLLVKTGLVGLQLGAAVQNLGSQVNDSNLPLNAKAGLAYALPVKLAEGDTWNVLADVNVPFGDTQYISGNFGTEYWFSRFLAVRAGYQIKDSGDLNGLTGLTAGLGARIAVSEGMNLSVDYALATYGDLGMTHQIMISAGLK